jgi:hypothetical protein
VKIAAKSRGCLRRVGELLCAAGPSKSPG